MKTLKLLIIGLAVLYLNVPIHAQTKPGSLRGTVTEAKTGETLPFANIIIKDKGGKIIAGGSTDFDGKYNINPVAAGTYHVEAAFTGYSTVTINDLMISPNIPTIQNFKLQEESAELQEVVIMYERPLIDATKTSSVTTYDRNYLPPLGSTNTQSKKSRKQSTTNVAVRDATSVAAQAAGVTVNSSNSNIRGARDEGTVYFIDGVKVRGSSNIPQAAIAQTEVITGGLPAQYGDAESGAIQIPNQVNHTTPPAPAPVFQPTRSVVNESYSLIKEMPFKRVSSAPLSTFSSDVDAASYSNMRRFITDGQLPPVDAVRIDEMINYFDYSYPEPEDGEVFSMSTELAECPWKKEHQLLKIGIKTKSVDKENLPDNNLVFLIDVSGSMGSYDKLPLLQKSLRLLVDNLNDRDRVAIVVYASASGLVLESTKGTNKQKILDAIDNLSAGGSTAGGAGIKLAYKVALDNFKKGENNRVILATDGDFNVGVSSDEGLVKLIEKKREDGIFLTVLGFGTGNVKDSKMEKLADHGNGNYAYIDNLMEAQKVLVHEMGSTLNTVAKDTKFQIEFNPNQVLGYRLIGYENRILNDEDFNDDTKDAGDVGSGHSVTAIYEIIPAKGEEEMPAPPVDPLKYQQKVVMENPELASEVATLKIRYKAPDSDVSVLRSTVVPQLQEDAEVSEDFKFVSAVVQYGMLLRESQYKGESSFDNALALAKEGKGEDPNGYRGEFIRLVSLAEKLDKRRDVGMR